MQALEPLDPHRGAVTIALETVGALDQAFLIRHPWAPEFVYLAGQCNGQNVGGGGVSLGEALFRCAGESAEASVDPKDLPEDAASPHPGLVGRWPESERRILAVHTMNGAKISLPGRAFVGDRAPGHAPASLGFGAALNQDDADLSATLELIERDAAHRWWTGETLPIAVPLETLAGPTGALPALRGGHTGRVAHALALPSPTDVPVAAVFSTDRDGRGLAVGLKSALTWGRAVRGAMIEMLQMELALSLSRDRAGAPLSGDSQTRALARLDIAEFDAFRGVCGAFPPAPALSGFDSLASHLSSKRMDLYMTRFAQSGGDRTFRVTKAACPHLYPMPGGPRTAKAGAPGHETELM
ncbi:MAG: YcaO-like family protein [Pseudomonadota bacterium]